MSSPFTSTGTPGNAPSYFGGNIPNMTRYFQSLGLAGPNAGFGDQQNSSYSPVVGSPRIQNPSFGDEGLSQRTPRMSTGLTLPNPVGNPNNPPPFQPPIETLPGGPNTFNRGGSGFSNPKLITPSGRFSSPSLAGRWGGTAVRPNEPIAPGGFYEATGLERPVESTRFTRLERPVSNEPVSREGELFNIIPRLSTSDELTSPTSNINNTTRISTPNTSQIPMPGQAPSNVNYATFSQTGGYSPEQIADLRARMTSGIPSLYDAINRNLATQRARQGGYAPGYSSSLLRSGRDAAQSAADANINAESTIQNMVREGQLQGLGGLERMYSAVPGDVSMYDRNILSEMGIGSGEASRRLAMLGALAEPEARGAAQQDVAGSWQNILDMIIRGIGAAPSIWDSLINFPNTRQNAFAF